MIKMIKRFSEFTNESISRNNDMENKRKVEIAGIKIGDNIKFEKSTSLLRRIFPKFKDKVAGHGEEYFLKDEVYKFVNYWSDLSNSGFNYEETLAMEFECLESKKENRKGYKFVMSLQNFHEYKDDGIFSIL